MMTTKFLDTNAPALLNHPASEQARDKLKKALLELGAAIEFMAFVTADVREEVANERYLEKFTKNYDDNADNS